MLVVVQIDVSLVELERDGPLAEREAEFTV